MQLLKKKRKDPTSFICFGIGNLSNLAVVKNLCFVANNTFFF